jgi:hypothetical protein
MAGRIQNPIPEKWRHQDHIKPLHRVREVRMPTPTRADPDESTIGFGITGGPIGTSGGGPAESRQGDDGLPTTIRRTPVFPGNSVSEAPEKPHDDPSTPLRGKQQAAFKRPIVPANTAKDSVLGEHVQGPVSQRYNDRQTKTRGGVYNGTLMHSNRPADPEIEI